MPSWKLCRRGRRDGAGRPGGHMVTQKQAPALTTETPAPGEGK